MIKRIELVPVSGIKSSYPKKYRPKERLDISVFNNVGQRGNFLCSDMIDALKELDKKVSEKKGNLYVIDAFRTWDIQAENRKKYETGAKKAFVSKPGGSFHNAGRALDISVKELGFEGVDKDEWLQLFWDLCKPLGFHPIIKIPDLGTSECWHFDFPGDDWSDAYDSLSYPEVAKCATLDVGEWDPKETEDKVQKMFIQSQLIRLGYFEIGKVDGVIGSKTKKALGETGCGGNSQLDQANYLSKIQK